MVARSLAALVLMLAATVAGGLWLDAGRAGASAAQGRVGFSLLPPRVAQGQTVKVALSVRPASTRCTLAVRYAGGSRQPGLAAQNAVAGRASWSWLVPLSAKAGPAKLTVACSKAGSASRTIVIVGAKSVGHIDVVKDGFSIRVRPSGGSTVSYGAVLSNNSRTDDAVSLTVLVNMVDGSDHLVGSAVQRVESIPAAATTFAVGGSLSFTGAARAARLEEVIQVGSWTKARSKMPLADNVGIAESPYDPGWAGQLQGDLVNGDKVQTLARATLTAVVFDSAGNVIGGGQGFTVTSLPDGTRQFFTIRSGVDAIPFPKAASTLISMQPTYQPPGS